MAEILQHPRAEFYKYFQDRGLTDKEAVSGLGAERIPPDELADHIPKYTASKWEIHGCSGAMVRTIDIHGEVTEAYTVRRIGGNVPPAVEDKVGKVSYPKNVLPRAHFPRGNPELEKGTIIFLCESVIKAEIVAKCGFYAIGVNGCWGFSRNNQMMSDLKALPWELIAQIRVFYDSNYSTSDHVKAAANRFAAYCKQEINFDAVEITVLPPSPGGEDWGCDDAFVSHGIDWLIAVLEGDSIKPEYSEMDDMLFIMNEGICIVQSTARVYRYDLENIVEYTFGDVHNMYAHLRVLGPPPKSGAAKMEAVSRRWVTWKHRAEVPAIEMKPYEPRVVHGKFLNGWWDPKLEAGSPSKRWSAFMDNFIEDDESRVWLNQWIGHLIQNQAMKIHSYPVLVSGPGTGKTMITTMIERLLGAPNCALIGQEDIESSFNGFYAEKLFVAINEFERRQGRNQHTGVGTKMKRIVTETTTMSNSKNIKHRAVKAVANYMITTNEIGALKLDEEERRAGVIDCTPIVSHYGDVEYFAPLFHEILEEPEGIFGYYMEMDLAGFDRVGNAVVTAAKEEMTESTRTPMERFVHDLMNDTEATLKEYRMDPSIRYVSIRLLLATPSIQAALGIDPFKLSSSHAMLLGAAFKRGGGLLLAGSMKGQVSHKGVKHKIYVLPGGSRGADKVEWEAHLIKWGSKVSK